MTGFGRAERKIGSYQVTVEARSVNHRYLDLRFRLPPAFQTFESALAEMVRRHVQRGSVDLSIRQKLGAQEALTEGTTRFVVDKRAAASYFEACRFLHSEYKTAAVPSLEALQATGKVILPVEDAVDAGPFPAEMKALVEQALAALVADREREGAQTRATLQDTVKSLQALSRLWRTAADGHPEKIRERLTKRLAQWAVQPVDAQRLEVEVAFFADRADISEEIQRFEAHLEEFAKLTASGTAVGRKLDFLTQELHRETNTVASKADDLTLSRLAVEAKTAIEKLREQVQNVE